MGKKYYKKKKTLKVAKNIKKYVSKAIKDDHESHYFDFRTTNQSVSNTATIQPLLSVTQGVGDTQRIGDAIKIKSINLSYLITGHTPNALYSLNQGWAVRIMIIQWKGDTTPLVAGILDDSTTFDVAVSQYAMDYKRKNFNVLHDRVHYIAVAGPGAGGVHNKKIKRKYSRLITWDAAGTSPINNDIYLLHVSSFEGATNEIAPSLTLSMRTEFSDN